MGLPRLAGEVFRFRIVDFDCEKGEFSQGSVDYSKWSRSSSRLKKDYQVQAEVY